MIIFHLNLTKNSGRVAGFFNLNFKIMLNVLNQAKKAREASKILRQASTKQKNNFLNKLTDLLNENFDKIIEENKKDLNVKNDITPAMKKRLELSLKGLKAIAKGVREIAKQEDPVGKKDKCWRRPSGFEVCKVRVPIGVIACIFESRPNIIVDVSSLCVKSGNAAIVRGGKEAINSNNVLIGLIHQALEQSGLPYNAVQQLEDRRYEAVDELVQLDEYLDLVVPRGRESLIKAVSAKAKMPVIKHTRGLCHAYIDSEADPEKAIKIAINAKISNPATCNSIETLLVHRQIADKVLSRLLSELIDKGVEIRACPKTMPYYEKCKPATEDDWSEEYLDLILAVKIVDSYEEAVTHIQKFSSGLTDSIISENKTKQEDFLQAIDSAVVLVNASNRLADGGVFGLGAEIGISTNRIHMRGPMCLEDLTVTKYVVLGNGHVRE